MPIKIHHGPPGSYKTAGAMGDDFLREAKAGRVIVTNVRGVTRERVLDEFPDLPDSFDVINVGDKTPEDRQKWARWFHWVPYGAFIFVDEIQMIWPKSWRDADIRALDYVGGVAQATADNRPASWSEAFEKHRHWNWDMVFTTPSYKKVRDDIKECAEMAYKHKNLAIIGIRGRYIEAAHMADDTGAYSSDFLTVNQKKVPPYVFRIYDSTATGAVTDTKSGISILQNPRILILLGVLVGCVYWTTRGPSTTLFPTVTTAADKKALDSKQAVVQPVSSSGAPAADVPRRGSAGGSGAPLSGVIPFEEGDGYIAMSIKTAKGWRYLINHRGYDFSSQQIEEMGFKVSSLGSCAVRLVQDHVDRVFLCGGREKEGQGDLNKVASNSVLPDTKPAPTEAPQAQPAQPPVTAPAAPPVVPADSPWRYKNT